jgi:hypothetical protein
MGPPESSDAAMEPAYTFPPTSDHKRNEPHTGLAKRRRGDRMALFGMPRGNATAWVSKPRHRSPPIRPEDTHSRAGPWLQDTPLRQLVESTSYQSARQKGRSRSEKRSATGACHHPLPSPPSVPDANIPRGPNQPGQIEPFDLARHLAPKSKLNKNSKNTLIRSDTTDPIQTPFTRHAQTGTE